MVPVSFLRLLNYVYLSITYSLPGHKSKPLRNRFISPAAGHTRRCYKYRAVPAPPRRSPAGRVETHRESCHYGGRRGTRLRPLSLGMPKPMVPLLGRPVMEHIISLLKRHGIDEIAVTLCYMPEAVQSYFGDGQKWGVRLHYFIEEAPLGTAGSVRACAPLPGGRGLPWSSAETASATWISLPPWSSIRPSGPRPPWSSSVIPRPWVRAGPHRRGAAGGPALWRSPPGGRW